jgi:hypothetical protein
LTVQSSFRPIPVLLFALCACHRDEETIAVPVADGFQPLSISVQIEDENLALTFLSPERAQIIVSTQAQEHLDDDEPVVRTVAVVPDSYRQTRAGIIALMTANGIRAEGIHGPESRIMSISIGGVSGQLMMNIARDQKGGLPDGCLALRALVESYLHAPDIDAGKGR